MNNVDTSSTAVVWFGRLFQHNGYSVVTRSYIQALARAGVYILAIDSTSGVTLTYRNSINHDIFAELEKDTNILRITSRSEKVLVVLHEVPEKFPVDIVSNIHELFVSSYVVAETYPVPDSWPKRIDKICNLLMTSSRYCEFIFKRSGVNIPIVSIPHTIDFKMFGNTKKSPDFVFFDNTRNDEVVLSNAPAQKSFLSVVSNYNRKDLASLVQAYLNSQIGKNSNRLIIKLPSHSTKSGLDGNLYSFFGGRDSFLLLATQNNIYTLTADFTDSQVYSLIVFNDFLVTTERAKGWDMNAMEALALGVPTISVDYSASQEFVNADNSILIESHGECLADPCLYGNPQLYAGRSWANTRVSDIESAFLFASQIRESEYLKLSEASRKIARNYSYERVGVYMFSTLLKHCDDIKADKTL